MSMLRDNLFSTLFQNFLKLNKEIEAIIASDEEGFVLASEKRADINIEIVSFLTAVVNPVLERIRNEFSFQKFGTANFDTENHRLLFISVNEKTTLSFVLDMMAWVDKLSPFAYLLAEKVAQILTASEEDIKDFHMPNFEYEIDLGKKADQLKEQIYFKGMKTGGDFALKFIIIGDHEVGKTSLVRRIVDKKFSADYRATIGLNLLYHKIEMSGNRLNLNLWDIGAQQYFKRFRKTYYDGAEAAFLVFDLTNKKSFENVKNWMNELREFTNNRDLPIVLIGNKLDLVDKRAIKYEDGLKLAKDFSSLVDLYEKSELSKFSDLSKAPGGSGSKIAYLETSAKTGERVEEAFNIICFNYLLKCAESDELTHKKAILQELNSALKYRKPLTLTFVSYDVMWSPGMQIIADIKELGNFNQDKAKKKELICSYASGLTLKGYDLDSAKVDDADGVFCIFDARDKQQIEPKWNDLILKMLGKMQENRVMLIGLRVSNGSNYTKLVEGFNINDQINKKFVAVMFFKLESEFKQEVYKQLETMLKSINELLFRL